MGLSDVLPVTEAGAFTLGCALLWEGPFDPDRLGPVLAAAAILLAAALLVVLTPGDVSLDPSDLDPPGVWHAGGADPQYRSPPRS